MARLRRIGAYLAIASAIVLAAPRARADDPQPPVPPAEDAAGEDAEAQRLFEEARQLVARGELVLACARFQASHEKKPTATGPLVNLALCNERIGRYASAVAQYAQVLELAPGSRPDRVAFAKERLLELQLRMSSLAVTVPQDARAGDLEVRLDGKPLPAASWDKEVPIDGGEHVVEATATGRRSFRSTVIVKQERDRAAVTIEVPEIRDRRPAAYVVGGVGIVALAVGVGVGISVAAECGGFFKNVCEGPNQKPTDEEREKALRSVQTRAWISDIAAGAGVIALGIGTALYFTSDRNPNAAYVRLRPLAQGGVAFDARF